MYILTICNENYQSYHKFFKKIMDPINEFEHHKFIADKGQNPLRVDKYLQNFVEFATRSKIQQSIKMVM